MTIQELVHEYSIYCQARGLRPATLRTYSWALSRFTSLISIWPSRPRQLLPVFSDPTLSQESRLDLKRSLATFFRWAESEFQLPPADHLLPKLPHHRLQPRVLSTEEIGLLWLACRTKQQQALISLGLDTGLRLGEIATLQPHHIYPSHLRVQGKTGQRQVPISPNTYELLIATVPWTGRRGKLTTSGVRQLIVKTMLAARLQGEKLGPHCLRHTFATHYLARGGNVRVLQDILGHTSLNMTMHYVHLAARDVAHDHARYSPVQLVLAEAARPGTPTPAIAEIK